MNYFKVLLLFFVTSFAQSQSKTLVVLAHPNLSHSEVNKSFAERLSGIDIVTLDNLYSKYPDSHINIHDEQELVMAHDVIIFQFPLYWFSSPSLLKKWQDEVITSEFSIHENNQLKGKKLLLVVSAGGTEKDYHHGGAIDITMDEVLTPFESFAQLTEMEYVSPFITYGVPNPKILGISMTEKQKDERRKFIKMRGDKLLQLIHSLE